jgi:hypothetical protein
VHIYRAHKLIKFTKNSVKNHTYFSQSYFVQNFKLTKKSCTHGRACSKKKIKLGPLHGSFFCCGQANLPRQARNPSGYWLLLQAQENQSWCGVHISSLSLLMIGVSALRHGPCVLHYSQIYQIEPDTSQAGHRLLTHYRKLLNLLGSRPS